MLCSNSIVKTKLHHVLMKHRMSRNEALRPFTQDGLDFERITGGALEQIRAFCGNHAVVIAKPSWGKAGAGILTSSDPDEIVAHVRKEQRK